MNPNQTWQCLSAAPTPRLKSVLAVKTFALGQDHEPFVTHRPSSSADQTDDLSSIRFRQTEGSFFPRPVIFVYLNSFCRTARHTGLLREQVLVPLCFLGGARHCRHLSDWIISILYAHSRKAARHFIFIFMFYFCKHLRPEALMTCLQKKVGPARFLHFQPLTSHIKAVRYFPLMCFFETKKNNSMWPLCGASSFVGCLSACSWWKGTFSLTELERKALAHSQPWSLLAKFLSAIWKISHSSVGVMWSS